MRTTSQILISILFILDFINIALSGHIYSSDLFTNYDFLGQIESFVIPFKLENGLGENQYIEIEWPFSLGSAAQVSATFSLDQNSMPITNEIFTDPISSTAATDSRYMFKVNFEIKQNVWYRILIKTIIPIKPYPSNRLPTQPIQMHTLSYGSLTNERIIYDLNYALGYVYLSDRLDSDATDSITTDKLKFQVTIQGISLNVNSPGASYFVNIDITPSIASFQGSIFTLYIDKGTNVEGTSSSSDFIFQGMCSSVENLCTNAAVVGCKTIQQVKSSCQISAQNNKIIFQHLKGYIVGQFFRIRAEIKNPLYNSIRDLKLYASSLTNGRVLEQGRILQFLSVNMIDIYQGRRKYLWGIDSQQTISDVPNFPFQLFGEAKTGVSRLGPLNSIYIGFQLQKLVPVNAQYQVKVKIEASGVLEGSIVVNFPGLDKGLRPKCYYMYPEVICIEVGSFTSTTTEYFMSCQAFYDQTISAAINFGSVQIETVVYDDQSILITDVQLYRDLVGDLVSVVESEEYLDSGVGGWHEDGQKNLGTTQIVTAYDDHTQAATPNAIKNYVGGTSSVVGISPDPSTYQQLLFFMKLADAKYHSGPPSKYLKMEILFNPSQIQFENGFDTLGIDIAAYKSPDQWKVDTFLCFQFSQCTWYNIPQTTASQPKNTITYPNPTTVHSQPWALITFECGTKSLVGANANNPANCDFLQGNGITDGKGGVFSMRRVRFNSGFHSQIYADDKIIDFVIVFSYSSIITTDIIGPWVLQGQSIINAYTIEPNKLLNIKASYINFYDKGGVNNKGIKVPMMLRIGGSISPPENKGADTVLIFFDDAISSSDFYDEVNDAANFKLGCTAGVCQYYPAQNTKFSINSWMNNRMYEVQGIPKIQDQFSILIPCTNIPGKFPNSLVIAFVTSNYISNGVEGLNYVKSVYRVNGPAIRESFEFSANSITVGQLITNTGTLISDFTTNFQEFATGGTTQFDYTIDVTKIQPNGQDSTLVENQLSVMPDSYFGDNLFGAGVTITSIHYNIFQNALIGFVNPGSGIPTTCVQFSYKYNNAAYPKIDKKLIYTVFCPIDQQISNFGTTNYDIRIINPTYPALFVKDFSLSPILSHSLSMNTGNLIAFQIDIGVIPTASGTNACFTYITKNPLRPKSPGQQRVEFNAILSAPLTLDNTAINGYSFFETTITLSSSVTNFLFDTTQCVVINSPSLVCTYTQTLAILVFKFSVCSTAGCPSILKLISGEELRFYTYGTSSTSLDLVPSTGITYKFDVKIPTISALDNLFGTTIGTVVLFHCKDAVFNLTNTAYGSQIGSKGVNFAQNEIASRGAFNFNFQSVSYREQFFATYAYEINMGFLKSPNENQKNANFFRCMVLNSADGSVSRLWQKFDMTNMLNAQLIPKQQFYQINEFNFTLQCLGGATADTVEQNQKLNVQLTDGATVIQSLPDISFPSTIITSSKTFATLPQLINKFFISEGFDAAYTFQITTPSQLDFSSRVMVEFPWMIPPRLNREGYLECYIRMDSAVAPGTLFQPSYCEFSFQRRVTVEFTKPVPAGTVFYLDIYGVTQPFSGLFAPNTYQIWIGIDDDQKKENGILAHALIDDIIPLLGGTTTNVITPLQISSSVLTSLYTRSDCNITIQITFPAQIVKDGLYTFIDLTNYMSQELYRGQVLICGLFLFTDAIESNNYAKSCSMVTQRVLKLIFVTHSPNLVSEQTYNIRVFNLHNPSLLPKEKANEIKFKVYIPDSNEKAITHLSANYQSMPLIFIRDNRQIELNWNFISYFKDGNGVIKEVQDPQLDDLDPTSFPKVYIGYYSRYSQLSPAQDSGQFKTNFTWVFDEMISKFKLGNESFTAITETQNTRFLISALQTTQAGIYIITAKKTSGDADSIYSPIPPIHIAVRGDKCQINSRDTVYYIPVGGNSMPVLFDFFNCIPIDDLELVPSLPTPYGDMIIIKNQLSSKQLNNSAKAPGAPLNSMSTLIFFVLAQKTPNTVAIGSSFSLMFDVIGTNNVSFQAPVPVQITLVDPSLEKYTLGIDAFEITDIYVDRNRMSCSFQCSQEARIYWVIGLESGLANENIETIRAQIESEDLGLIQNKTIPNDPSWRVYGSEIFSVLQKPLEITFYYLKSQGNYQLKYYCVNQLEKVSEASSSLFTVDDNGSFMMRSILWFNSTITYKQAQEITCLLARYFQVGYLRVYNEMGASCETPTFVPQILQNSLYAQFPQLNQYPYYFYFMPDSGSQFDNLNYMMREQSSDPTFYSKLIKMANIPEEYPALVAIENQDVTESQIPVIIPQTKIASANKVQVSFAIDNQDGFILVALSPGISSSVPTVENLRNAVTKDLVPITMMEYRECQKNIEQLFRFNELKENSTYQIFYYASNEDPSNLAVTSQVSQFVILTESLQSKTTNGNQLTLSTLISLLVVFYLYLV